MRRSAMLKEQRAELLDQAQAVNDICGTEKREPNETETSLLADIMGVDGKAGKVDALAKQIEQAERIENLAAELKGRRTGVIPQLDDPDVPQGAEKQRVFACPATVRLHGRLNAFRGPVAEAKAKAFAFGQWFLAIHQQEPAMAYCRDHGVPFVKAALTTGDNATGGYLVPTEFDASIIDLRNEYGVFRRESNVVPMGSDTRSQPKRTGGVTAHFVAENVAPADSDKAWTNVSLTAKKLMALVKYSSELNEDAVVSMADDLATEIAVAFATKEDECGFNGDATATYGGITGLKSALQAGSLVTAVAGNTSYGELDMADFLGMLAKVQSYAITRGNAKWYMHRSGWATSMLRLMAAAGGNTVQNLAGNVVPSFIGYPVVFVECMNSVLTVQATTKGLCYFGDLRAAAMLGSRRGITITTSADRYFDQDQIAIKGTERFDVNVHEVGTASVSGAIVGLQTP